MNARVLFVDDEPNILDGIRRTTRGKIDATFAVGPQEALRVVTEAGPFALVISDLRMPGMSGVALLREVRRLSPETVRIILSGHADLEATIAAVNEGQLFRFLTKPCDPDALLTAVSDGVDQYRLVMAEKELLEKTLSGAVQVLTEILAMVNPEAYGRSSRVTRFAVSIADAINLPDRWQIRLAAMLSQIGCVALPEDVAAKSDAGQKLEPHEQELFDGHRRIAAKLLANIPRLDHVVAIIADSDASEAPARSTSDLATMDVVGAGQLILRAATEFDRSLRAGMPRATAVGHLARTVPGLPTAALDALRATPTTTTDVVRRAVALRDLGIGMVLDEDVLSAKGVRLVRQGQEVTPALLARLRSYADGVGVVEPIRVQIGG